MSFADRLTPLDTWMLIKIPSKAAGAKDLQVAKSRPGKEGYELEEVGRRENVGIVVKCGPGGYEANGNYVKPDERLVPGAEIIFMGPAKQRPQDLQREFADEGLYFLPIAAVICILAPAERPAMALVT